MRVHWTREYHLQRILYFYFTILFKLDILFYISVQKKNYYLFFLNRATSTSWWMFCCFLSSRLAGDTGFEWSPKPKGVVPTVAFEMNPQDSLRSPDSTLPLRAHSDRFIPFSQGIWLSRDSRKLPESACRRWLSSRNRFQLSRWKAVGDRVRNSWMRKQIQLYLIYNSHLQRTRTISICTPTKDTQKLSQKFNFVS